MGIATFATCSMIIAILVICYGWVAGVLALIAMGLVLIWVLHSLSEYFTRLP